MTSRFLSGLNRMETVQGAEVTSSAFGLMETAPLLGRTLTAQDERPAEPPVVVINETTATATVVGVMPEAFGFPVSESIWPGIRRVHRRCAGRAGRNRSTPGGQHWQRESIGRELARRPPGGEGLHQRHAAVRVYVR